MKSGIHNLSAGIYHADPCDTPSLSNSIANILLRQSPQHAFMAHPRLNPDYEGEDDKKFDKGTAAHCLLLEGANKIAVLEFDDYRKDAAKVARDEALLAGKLPILAPQYHDVEQMARIAKQAIADCPDLGGTMLESDGYAEQTVIWQEGKAWFRSRLDWLSHDYRLILDYKTTDIATPDSWMRGICNHGYDIQPSFYKRGVKAVTGVKANFVFVVQEATAPYSVYFVGVPPAYEALGDEKVEEAKTIWQQCMSTGKWPAYTNRIMYPDLKPWMESEWIEQREQRKEFASQVDPLQLKHGVQI